MTESADYVIVGGGAAGCIVAARLSEEPDARVLLLEAGAKHRTPLLSIPAGEILLLGNPRYDWGFETEPDPTLNGRRIRIPRGRLLGGSNAINGMIFVRGQPEDYDSWARDGAAGWSYCDVLPFFRRLESWQGGGSEARGADGPIRVELPRQSEPLCDVFVAAAMQAGYPGNSDYNSGRQEGFGYYQCTQKAGERSSVARGYLRAARRRPNLRVVTGARVETLLWEGRRCVGVGYRRGDARHEVACAREVVLSAGVVQSPQLLELSGIGCPSVLARAGIPVRHELPGVGESFHDHFAARLRWRVLQRVTYNERTRGAALLGEIARYVIARRGVLSLPIAVGFGFVRSSPAEPLPDLQLHFAPASYGAGATRRLEAEPGMTLGVYPLRPDSRGSVHVASRDPLAPPVIRSMFLAAESDCRRMVQGIRIARRIAASAAFDPYRGRELTPGPGIEADGDLLDYVREQGDTSYHPVGTCRMGADRLAVVDSRLRVHGVDRLRVVDASIMPRIVSGNTNAATMMIAEKGAAMIREDMRTSKRIVTGGETAKAA